MISQSEATGRLEGLQPDNLSTRVFDAIQTAIRDKTLAPGRRVTEADLAAQLDVSKTPVREAFIKLRQIGLLEPDGRRAWRVIQLSRRTIDDACDVREALEVSAARSAAERATPEQREQLRDAAERSLAAARAGDRDGFREWDERFHDAVAEASGNTRMRTLIDDTLLLIATLRQRDLPHREASIACGEAHVAIAATIASGGRAAAGEAMRAHVQQVKDLTFGDLD
jgi:GntR family transcriptional regulator, rspAB operon transcriptional repressor